LKLWKPWNPLKLSPKQKGNPEKNHFPPIEAAVGAADPLNNPLETEEIFSVAPPSHFMAGTGSFTSKRTFSGSPAPKLNKPDPTVENMVLLMPPFPLRMIPKLQPYLLHPRRYFNMHCHNTLRH
jgi:hypothetical protein